MTKSKCGIHLIMFPMICDTCENLEWDFERELYTCKIKPKCTKGGPKDDL
jgi:hypothetical protein